MSDGAAIGFGRTATLLLAAARRRARGRRKRARELLNSQRGGHGIDWGWFGTVVSVLFMTFVHGAAAFAIIIAVGTGQRIEADHQGKFVVTQWFLDPVLYKEETARSSPDSQVTIEMDYRLQAELIAERSGGDPADIEQRLRAEVATSGSRDLISSKQAEPGMTALARAGPAATALGSILLLWWFVMLVCQGDGLELDLQRRRHPMWEWLLSHPVGARPVFFAEMLSPLFANPAYWAAPLFIAILYGASQGVLAGLIAAILIGVPVTIAAGCVGKALEVWALLRLPPRNRGAFVGILSWFGYASMLLTLLGVTVFPTLIPVLVRWVDAAGMPSWPLLPVMLGLDADGGFSLWRGVLACDAASALVIAAAVFFSARSVRNGLAGAFPSDTLPRRSKGKVSFGREPLYRKEYLWFVRDRSALVQAILLPLTVAVFQVFNLRMLLEHAGEAWNYLAGAAIFFGTYFLWVLGPKSLVSEGSALWLTLTWPRGLEAILKAKARLWSLIASALVGVVLLATCWIFPSDAWKVALTGIGWWYFARSMAEKSVTLVTVVSDSGEATQISSGRRWAAQLGMLTFAIGVLTQQWNLAIVGIVYSWITAAAMWENLRARLPYLYDPWSERLPPPPTLMHAMVSISILIECAAVITGAVVALGGRDSLALAQGLGYAACAVGVSVGVSSFLAKRGVSPVQIWCWRDDEPAPATRESWVRRYIAADSDNLRWLLIAVVGGGLLALLAHAYLMAISLVPGIGDLIRASQQQMQSVPGLTAAFAVIAIGFAPFAEEYLFRGLVFRKLDEHWGGWKAVAAAAAFFAIYHPLLSWLPVAVLGAANCLIFKRSKRLAPAVLLHMTYNAVVAFWS